MANSIHLQTPSPITVQLVLFPIPINPRHFLPSVPFHSLPVVTGATDGIGREYAKGLARQKINVVVISRTESKLRDFCNELEMEHRVKTKFIVADFSQGKPIYAHIERELQGIPVGILGAKN